MKYRLLRLSLLSMLVMLFGGFSLAAILEATGNEEQETLTLNTAAGYAELTVTNAGTSGSGSAMEFSKGDIVVTSEKGYIKDHEMTIYAGGTMTVGFTAGTNAHITKVELTVKNYHFAKPEGWTSEYSNDVTTKINSDETETFTTDATDKTSFTISNASSGKTTVKKIVVTYVKDSQSTATFKDIKADLTTLVPEGAAQWSDVSTGITVAEDGTLSRIDKEGASIVFNGKWHGTQYGWANFTATVPVTSCVKITYGTNNYGSEVTVTNAEGAEVAKLNNKDNNIWDPSNADRVVTAYYRTNAATTLSFSKCDYVRYFAVEAISEADLPAEVTNYNITFAAGEGATGVAPAALEIQAGSKFTAPKNYTLYKEGATLTGWNDGTKTYAIGEEITPAADMTLTAVYTANEVSLADRTEAVTISYELGGYNDNPKYKFEGNTGFMVSQATVNGKVIDVKVDVDATSGKFAHNGSGWHQVNAGTKVTVPSCKNAVIKVSTYNAATSVSFNGNAGTADENTAVYTATAEDATCEIAQVANNYWNKLTVTLPKTEQGGEEPTFPITATWDFTNRDVVAAVVALSSATEAGTIKAVEDNGLLLTVEANGKLIRDNGNSIQTGDGVVFKVPVQGKKDVVTVVGYAAPYFAYSIAGTDATEATTAYTATAADVAQGFVEIINKGQYLISISVIQNEDTEPQPVNQDITGTWDYSNAAVMEATMALSGSNEAGEVSSIEGTLKMTVLANGASFRNNGSNIQVRTGAEFRIPVRTAGDLVTIKGYPSYSYYKINDGDEITNTNDNPQTEYKAKGSDAERGYVSVVSTNGNNYFLSLSVVQYAPKEKTTLDNEPATATFPFNEGTEGQKATFSNADYFLSSKVNVGSNWSILDKYTYAGTDETRLTPVDQHDDNLTDADAVSFVITPKPGFTFTPTKVSFKANRFGTDNGLIDAYWQNANGTTVELEKGIKPERNNSNKNTEKSYDITGATAGEGTCGLKLFLYHLQAGKQIGLADIVIEGILNGTEKDVPVLASFKVNGIEYAAENVFGDDFEATLKLSKKDNMVSAENPLTDVIATNGEIGTITYEGDETACKVTIPMTAGTVQQDYVLNVIQKPDYTLSYIDVDGTTVLDTQTLEEDQAIGEFKVDIANVAATKDGFKARGWFKQPYQGEKFTTDYVVTGDTKLYALQTEIEGPSDSRKYSFNLTDQFFYAEDHEAFNPTGGVWHDKQHGWVFANGDQIELLVGKKANINFTFCQFSAADATISASNGQSIKAVTEGACSAGTLAYEGEEGKLTLTINASGDVYIHDITIFNTTTTNYDKQGDWLIVKQGDASSFLDAIEAAKGIEGAKVFLPNGTYDLGETVKTSVSGTNVSIIGQSAENTIVVNRPPLEWEGLDKADLLKTSATGLYMQDLSLKNDLPYTGNNGRAASLHDVGTKTICKNVNLLSYQDTYYSNKTGGLFYFEGGELHGTVDYLCGDGRVYFNECKIVNEQRSTATISANSELYVFNNCVVENNADKYNLGRAWSNNPVCVYLNTTLLDPSKLLDTRWNPSGINCDYSIAGEYGTKNAEGTDITPASNEVTFTKNNTKLETILSAEQAATYTMEYVLGDWAATAKQEAKQLEAPAAEFANGTVTWTPANDGAIAYMIEKNGEFVGITAGSSMAVEANAESDKLTIRAANARGGFGEAKQVAYTGTSIQAINAAIERGEQVIFNLAGQRVNKATKGMYIINGKKMVVK